MLFIRNFLKKYSFHSRVVFLVFILAALIRISLIALGWPPLESDEGVIGLMGMHIAYGKELPIFFYGQSYMGAWEAYVAAFFFKLFGISTFTLKLGVTLMTLGFIIAMYFFT